MYDSNPKIPHSLLTGNRIIFGNYDECIEIDHPDHLFTGQYCMFSAHVTVDVAENTTKKDDINFLQVHKVFITIF